MFGYSEMVFVGGVADGHKIVVEEGLPYFYVPHPPTLPVVDPPDNMEKVSAITKTRYERVLLRGKDRKFAIMTCLDTDETIAALIVGYKGFKE